MNALRIAVIIAVLLVIGISSGKHLRRTGTRGDIETYVHGARLVLAGADLYRTPEPRGQVSFMYLPLFAVLAIPLTFVPFEVAVVFWCALSVALAGFVVAGFLSVLAGRPFFSLPAKARWIVSGVAVLLTLRSLLQHLDLGQANLLVMAVAVLGLVLLASGRELAGGAAIGVAIVLKLIALPLAIVFLVQGRFRVLLGMAAGVLAGLLIPAAAVGFERNVSYISYWITEVVLAADDLRKTPYWPLEWNYSLAAQVYRFFSDVTAFEHDGRYYSVTLVRLPDATLLVLARLMPVLIGCVVALYAWLHRRRGELVALWGAVALAFCLAPAFSIVSLKHYYVTLLPAHVYIVYLWYVLNVRDRWFRGLVAASFVVSIVSTTLFDYLGALMSNLGGLVWGALLLAAAIFRATRVSESAPAIRDPRRDPESVS
jgi:Glycosyltransferase family 87